ncbi:MAG: efflux RND transporter permease subunit [Bacteroidota bacterium]
MNISELSLRRPILATVMNLVIILFGLIGYWYLGVREFPAVDPPLISVTTAYAVANADVVESQVTEPLEKAINGIPGIRTMTSTSSTGNSTISVEFNLGSDLEAAANDVRDKVSQAVKNLPQDLDALPVVTKQDASSDFILLMSLQSPTKGLLELSDYAENVLQNKFQTIPQVSAVNIFGARRPSMRIWIDPDRLTAHGVAFNDISRVLNAENIEVPTGKIHGDRTEMTIRASGRLTTEQQFRDLILRESKEGIVRLGDVARIEIGPENYELSWRLNGMPGVSIAVVPQPGANYIDIADEFYKRLDQLNKEQSGDIRLEPLIDVTKNVRRSLTEVKETLIIAFILVVLVILFFFRNWTIALRPLIDIPISLIATFAIMAAFGYSINVLTLLGIVLATGLVVDDGIVVTENIFRKLELGMPIRKAALEGSREIFFAVISTSLTLAVVFLPVMFLEGFVGSLFREFGVVLAGAVIISAFVSLTITPVLNVLLHRDRKGHGRFYEKTEPMFRAFEATYRRRLERFVERRYFSWIALVACIGIIYYLGTNLQSELAPLEDRSSVRFSLTGPEGASYGYMTEAGTELLDYLMDSVPERQFVFQLVPSVFSTGTNTGFGRLILCQPEQRDRTQSEIAQDLAKKVTRFNKLRVFPIEDQTISVGFASRGQLPVQFVLQNSDFEKIKNVLPLFLEAARSNKTFQNVDVNLKFNRPEVRMDVDRMRARELGLSMQDIAGTVQSAFSGRRIAYFTMNGKQYNVVSQVESGQRARPDDITRLDVRTSSGDLVPLSSVVTLNNTASPPTFYHFNRFKSATVSASLAEGKTIGDGIEVMNAIADTLLDETFQHSLSGPSRDFSESSSNILYAFLLALLLIYLVLAAQFESFRDPLTIMVTVPLALAGALLSLWLTGQTLNIFSEIGMIMLIGLVTKNGILIVEFANKKRDEGLSISDAVIQAASQRLRPILMTTLATALGALPIAIGLGSSASSRAPLGIVVVGGLIFSLVLTLFMIPALYLSISGKRKSVEETV